MKTVNGYDSPETVEEQRFTYRGWEIIWERPPIPSSLNCDWSAARDGHEEEGRCIRRRSRISRPKLTNGGWTTLARSAAAMI
jgi:hypothetical protein